MSYLITSEVLILKNDKKSGGFKSVIFSNDCSYLILVSHPSGSLGGRWAVLQTLQSISGTLKATRGYNVFPVLRRLIIYWENEVKHNQ